VDGQRRVLLVSVGQVGECAYGWEGREGYGVLRKLERVSAFVTQLNGSLVQLRRLRF